MSVVVTLQRTEDTLQAHYAYAFADGTYFSLIYGAEGQQKMPVWAVVGIQLTGAREVLGFTVGERENQSAWEDLLADLQRRGVQQVDLCITDGHQAMLNALQHQFAHSRRQRCAKHKVENVLSYIPTTQQQAVKPELRAIFYQESREKADQTLLFYTELDIPPLATMGSSSG